MTEYLMGRDSDDGHPSIQEEGGRPDQSASGSVSKGSEGDQKSTPETLSGLLTHLVDSTSEMSNVKMEDLFASLDSRSHGPMLLLPAIIAISPIGMIPWGQYCHWNTIDFNRCTDVIFFWTATLDSSTPGAI